MLPIISRRQVIQSALAGPLVLGSGSALAKPPKDRPNFLFIMADDLGFADLSCYGRDDYKTPHLDALAASGMQFMHSYANSAVCSATRTALATGRYQYRLPVGLEEPVAVRDVGLPPEHPTIASVLKDAGYATAVLGKWHLGSLPTYGPLQSGYEHFWGFRGGGVDYYTHKSPAKLPDLWDRDVPVEKTGYLTDLLGDHALAVLDDYAKGTRPFLMSLHFSAPHWPWEGLADDGEVARLDAKKGYLALAHFDGGTMALYREMVQRLDYQIGRILSHLKKRGLDKNTVVVFTSDNGGERFSKIWPFSGMKGELLEGGIRVPGIVRWPGLTKKGSKSDVPVISMDFMPTFAAAAGAKIPEAFASDGVDIRPALRGEPMAERPLFWRYKNHRQKAMRRGAWKYLEVAGNSFLFNVLNDTLERANLKDRYPDRFAAMQTEWSEWEATMLPLDPASQTHGPEATTAADRYGVK
jgi:arylsulfatase A-like enzyme